MLYPLEPVIQCKGGNWCSGYTGVKHGSNLSRQKW